MKKTTIIDHEAAAKANGRKVSAIIHIALFALLTFPFLQMVTPEKTEDIKIVMDFSSGSSAEGAKAVHKKATTPKAIEQPKSATPKPIVTIPAEDKVVVKEEVEKPTDEVEEVSEAAPSKNKSVENEDSKEPAAENGMGAGEKGAGDAVEGSASSGNGRGFIEGKGLLTRAVIDRGDTKKLAQVNGTLILKICINRRGVVTFAEWDKEASTIKDTGIARTALDNVLNYRFETDRNAPSKECGRLTYIIAVD